MARNVSEVAAPESKGGVVQQTRGRTEAGMRAPVDIYEDGEGITLEADMPGVSRERLDVRVDGDTLLLEGNVQFELPKDAEAMYADVRSEEHTSELQSHVNLVCRLLLEKKKKKKKQTNS